MNMSEKQPVDYSKTMPTKTLAEDSQHGFTTDEILDEIQHGSVEALVDDKKLQRKLDLILMPVICLTYALQSVDKVSLGYAAVFGLEDDLHLKGKQYSWLGSIFYLAYGLAEWPIAVLLQKFPVGKLLAVMVVLWGTTLACHAATTDFATIATARFFLGIFESSIQPIVMVIFSMFYKRIEQPFRIGLWIGAAGLGYVIAGIASFGIGHIHGALDSWRYTFLIWGVVIIAWGVVVFFVLPDNPEGARFLSVSDRKGVLFRIKDNETGVENRQWKKEQFVEALTDPKTLMLFIFAVTSNAPNGGLTTFQGLIIKGLGFSTLRTTLIQMPSGAVQFVVCTAATYVTSSFTNARLATMLACLAPFLAGTVGTWLLPESNPNGRLVCLWISFTYTATWSLSMSVVTANTAGHTKKATSAAVLLIGYCTGNFIGPFFFLESQAPTYDLGVAMMLFCIGVQVLSICGIWFLLWWRNKQRAAQADAHAVEGIAKGFNDETDLKNPYFKYVY